MYNRTILTILAGAACLCNAQSRELPLPDVPDSLYTPTGRAEYVLLHFWDAADFSSPVEMTDTVFMEQNFANFLSVMPHATELARHKAIAGLVDKTADGSAEASDLFSYFADLYLYRPESPFYDDQLYMMYIGEMNRRYPDNFHLSALKEQLAKNAPGTKAYDLAFVTPDGQEGRLSDFLGKTVVLIFYDPDCDRCHALAETLSSDATVTDAISAGDLAVLAVYPDDDIELWRNHAGDFPCQWVLGQDKAQSVNDYETYVLRSVPSVYLISPDGTVILHDATAETIIEKLR